MKPVRTFTVHPALPAQLARLHDLAYNLRWSWNHATIDLFRRLDRDLWETTGNNPVRLLGRVDQARLAAAAEDEAFLSHLEGVSRALDRYMAYPRTWYQRHFGDAPEPRVAYFSAEFALTNCMQIFSGGLGVLAGDHLKSASDLGVPLIGVGLLYQMGYFTQYLNDAGWQQERYDENDFRTMPIVPEHDAAGNPLVVKVPLGDHDVRAQVWRAQVGRVRLILLDTNIAGNKREDCDITDNLYGGDAELRIKQEIVLGIGGMRALAAIGVRPAVYHMNEGHSAFLALERVRQLIEEERLTFAEAREAASAGLIFTTHTAVPAGHDAFPRALVEKYLGKYATQLGLPIEEFLELGADDPRTPERSFSMSVLALHVASHVNGVSRLHGQVSRAMWQPLFGDLPQDEIPVDHITNGVHFCSWISQEMSQLYDRYLGPSWRDEANLEQVWGRARQIPGEELWRTHERRRERLVVYARNRLRKQLSRRSEFDPRHAEEVLNPGALTIGFARRFATYKRAGLILSDPDRLARIVGDPSRPVQFIFAGKAHPRDDPGKQIIQQIVSLARDPRFRRHIVFLEDYDMAMARYLVQGVDVWLSTPRRPMEASGTSGMKAAANGVLNLSVLDGWWAEAWEDGGGAAGTGGWAVGRGEAWADEKEQDRIEAEALYRILEDDVVPTFYDRDGAGLPQRWLDRMKSSLTELCPVFNTHRMVQEYTERFYQPAFELEHRLEDAGFSGARKMAEWRRRIVREWPRVAVTEVDGGPPEELVIGTEIHTRSRVRLGSLSPDDVEVQLYLGRVDAAGNIADAHAFPMVRVDGAGEEHVYETQGVSATSSGRLGLTVRILPRHFELGTGAVPGLIAWASASTEAPARAL